MTAGTDELGIHITQRYQRREWVIQRVFWILIGVVLFAALAGLLGSGHFSNARVQSGDGTLALEYQRFLRYQAETELRLSFPPQAGAELQLVLPASYVRDMGLTRMDPHPRATRSEGAYLVYAFDAVPAGMSITMHLAPRTFGRVHGRLRVQSGAELRFRHFVYP